MPDAGPTPPDDPAWVDDIVRRALERAGAEPPDQLDATAGQAAEIAPRPSGPSNPPEAPTPTPPPSTTPTPTPPSDTPTPTPPSTTPTPTPTSTTPTPPPSTTPTPPTSTTPTPPPSDTPTPPPMPVEAASEPASVDPGTAAHMGEDLRTLADEPAALAPDPQHDLHGEAVGATAVTAVVDHPRAGPYPDTTTDAEAWDGAIELEHDQHEEPGNRIRSFLEWGAVVVGALAVALVIKTFLMQAYYIPSESMVPTLEVGDRVLVNKLSYEFGDISRGDLVVFHRPPNQTGGEDDLIKRVIALEGETIEIRDDTIFITLPGTGEEQMLQEPYIEEGMRITSLVDTSNCDDPTPTACTIPDGHIFVMGDNRPGSRDSRAFGPISEDLVVGRAFLRVWPLAEIGFL